MPYSDIDTSPSPGGARVRQVPAVTRAIGILRLLGRHAEPMSLKDIAQQLDMVTSTCLHILRVLVEERLVKLDTATKRYKLGVGMLALAKSVIDSSPFPALAQPALDRLSAKWNVTAIGVEVTGLDHMVVLALSRSNTPFRLHVDVGSRFPALISATGRLVAAYTDVPEKEVERRFQALRWDNPPDLEAWRKEVQAVRRKGYSIDRGDYISGIVLVAAPVFDGLGRMTHSLVAAGFGEQLDGEGGQNLGKDLRSEAEALSGPLAMGG